MLKLIFMRGQAAKQHWRRMRKAYCSRRSAPAGKKKWPRRNPSFRLPSTSCLRRLFNPRRNPRTGRIFFWPHQLPHSAFPGIRIILPQGTRKGGRHGRFAHVKAHLSEIFTNVRNNNALAKEINSHDAGKDG
jgi:hypothetical protein